MMNIRNRFSGIVNVMLILFLSVLYSCKHTSYNTDSNARLRFSTQVLTFDTIFTSVSSITRTLKVYNPYNAAIKTDIALVGGSSSYYSINIDGVACRQSQEVEIAAKDSIFIFVKINIPPNQSDLPMLVADTLAFYTNGNRQNVDLLAFGQDAHFILPQAIYATPDGQGGVAGNIVAHEGETVHWTADRPYVIYGYAIIDSSATLIIEPGTRIYLHKNSGIWAYIGSSFQVKGTLDQPVTFQGDRTEAWYQDDYSQWDRIWLCESDRNHEISHAVISNAYIGIQAETIGNTMLGNTLLVQNTTIKKTELYGIYARSYHIQAYNNEIINSKQACVCLSAGGVYDFFHNTVYNAISAQRTMPAVVISNCDISADVNGRVSYGDCYAQLKNNIIYGTADNELYTTYINDAVMDLQLDYCLLKIKSSSLDTIPHGNNLLQNKNPLFKKTAKDDYDLSLSESSPCKSAGIYLPQVSSDKSSMPRSNPPTIGAHE